MDDYIIGLQYYWHNMVKPNESLYEYQSHRKAIIFELLCVYVFYWIIESQYYAQSVSERHHDQNTVQEKEQERLKEKRKFRIAFTNFFSNHIICVSFMIIYAPFEFQIFLSYLFLFCFFIAMYCEYKNSSINHFKLKRACYFLCYLINLIFIISGMYGIGRTKSMYQ